MLILVLRPLKTLVKEKLKNGKPTTNDITHDSTAANNCKADTKAQIKTHQGTVLNSISATETFMLKSKSLKANKKILKLSRLPKTTGAATTTVALGADVCSLSDEDDSLERQVTLSSPMKKISEVSNTVSRLRSSLLQLLVSLHYIRLRSRLSIQRIVSLLKLRQNSWVL